MAKNISNESEINKETIALTKELVELYPALKSTINEHDKAISKLNILAKRLDCCNAPIKYQPISNQMRLSLTKDKRQLENAINSNKDEVLITVTKKVASAAEGQKSSNSEKELINLIKSEIKQLDYMKHYKEIINNLQFLAARCQRLKHVVHYREQGPGDGGG